MVNDAYPYGVYELINDNGSDGDGHVVVFCMIMGNKITWFGLQQRGR